jgi:hypothetical protein
VRLATCRGPSWRTNLGGCNVVSGQSDVDGRLSPVKTCPFKNIGDKVTGGRLTKACCTLNGGSRRPATLAHCMVECPAAKAPRVVDQVSYCSSPWSCVAANLAGWMAYSGTGFCQCGRSPRHRVSVRLGLGSPTTIMASTG